MSDGWLMEAVEAAGWDCRAVKGCIEEFGHNLDPASPCVLPLEVLLTDWRPGSQHDDWTWTDEALDLWSRDPGMDHLATSIQTEGILRPILLGSDGRVWDGHHRIVVAMRLALEHLPVRMSALR